MKPWAYVAIGVMILSALSMGVSAVYNSGKNSAIADRVTVLTQGKEIDDEISSADKDGLYCYLVDCVDGVRDKSTGNN